MLLDVEIQFEWHINTGMDEDERWGEEKAEIWIIFMQIECINKSLVAFNSIDDVFM